MISARKFLLISAEAEAELPRPGVGLAVETRRSKDGHRDPALLFLQVGRSITIVPTNLQVEDLERAPSENDKRPSPASGKLKVVQVRSTKDPGLWAPKPVGNFWNLGSVWSQNPRTLRASF